MKRLITGVAIILTCVVSNSFASESAPDSLKLKGGEKGTTFGSLLIEGEDRVKVSFERPALGLDLDPRTAPGLAWEGIYSALARGGVNTMEPMWHTSAVRPPQVYVYPWMQAFQSGSVARFRPALDNVARWSLNVASPKGETVAHFAGDGKPPKELEWDGHTTAGGLAPPGYTYSYVVEAFDKAGNKRTFVGEGFELAAYRVDTADGVTLLVAGQDLVTNDATTPAALLETASWINRSADDRPVEVAVTAKSYAHGQQVLERITASLHPLLLGNPLRVQTRVDVAADAPAQGTVAIRIGK